MGKDKKDFFEELASQFKVRDNPVDLKPSIIGIVKSLKPLTVSIEDGSINLISGEQLYISEWFQLRTEIDNDKSLSEQVTSLLEQAKSIKETHSYGGASCTMPQSVSFLCDAVNLINSELLRYKCNLQVGDYVILASLEQTDSYVLIDKLQNEVLNVSRKYNTRTS